MSVLSCREEKQVETENVPATAKKVLETPFQFLLALPDYEATALTHDSDMFSTWGELALSRRSDSDTLRMKAREELLKSAKQAGWTTAKDLPNLEPSDLNRYGVRHAEEDLEIAQSVSLKGQNPPTRYGCRLWISEDGRRIVVVYRVDGE